MTTYQDFWIKLVDTERPDVYRVDVVSSPRGGGKSSFQFPFSIDDLGESLTRLGETIRGQARDVAKPIRPEEIGKALFDALFVQGTRDRFLESYGSIGEGGLRIKIDVDSDLPLLASLPWEYLYRHETRTFLSLDEKTSVVRYYNPPLEYKPLVVKPPLRILFVTASPSDFETLALDKEQSAILESLASVENIEVEFMSHATIETLANRILEPRPFHVLHFMGHGAFDRESGKGAIVLENPDGTGDLVDAERLKVLLGKDSNLRLVFLNACDTAKIPRQAGLDPFAGVATSLIMQGIPAVVAMQFPISDQAAILFARHFYKHLAQGHPVDAAVVKGRRSIYTRLDNSQEWGTPALFMRVPEGNIFEIQASRPRWKKTWRVLLAALGLLILAIILWRIFPVPGNGNGESLGITGVEMVFAGSDSMSCPYLLEDGSVSATIHVNQPETPVKYRWMLSGAQLEPSLEGEWREITVGGSLKSNIELSEAWKLSKTDAYTATLEIAKPEKRLEQISFNFTCFEVTALTVLVEPIEVEGQCPQKFTYQAEFDATGSGLMKYQWEKWVGNEYQPDRVYPRSKEIAEPGKHVLRDPSREYETGDYQIRLHILEPQEIYVEAPTFHVSCWTCSIDNTENGAKLRAMVIEDYIRDELSSKTYGFTDPDGCKRYDGRTILTEQFERTCGVPVTLESYWSTPQVGFGIPTYNSYGEAFQNARDMGNLPDVFVVGTPAEVTFWGERRLLRLDNYVAELPEDKLHREPDGHVYALFESARTATETPKIDATGAVIVGSSTQLCLLDQPLLIVINKNTPYPKAAAAYALFLAENYLAP